MASYLKTVNFGASKVGLSTVGYTLYNANGTINTARSTSGVYEVGSSTGNYLAKIAFPDKDEVVLLWDTGGATPTYAIDESTVQLNTIQESTDMVRAIWNTLKNNGELYSKLIKKIDNLKNLNTKIDLDEVIKEIKKIEFPSVPSLKDIKEALNVTVKAPEAKIAEAIIPDYTKQIESLGNAMVSINNSIKKIPTIQKDYTSDLSIILNKISLIGRDIVSNIEKSNKPLSKTDEIKSGVGSLLLEINKLQKKIVELENKVSSVDSNIVNTMQPSKFLQDIYQIMKQSEGLKAVTEEYQKKMNALKLAGL